MAPAPSVLGPADLSSDLSADLSSDLSFSNLAGLDEAWEDMQAVMLRTAAALESPAWEKPSTPDVVVLLEKFHWTGKRRS